MDLDDLLFRYFGTSEVSQVSPGAQLAGIERILVDLGLETDRGRRFALWALLHLLGSAPDLDVAFKDESNRTAARNFMDLLAAPRRWPSLGGTGTEHWGKITPFTSSKRRSRISSLAQ